MSYTKIKGNIFASKCQVLGNTVNCVGDMGKGIALEFRRRFPEMLHEYKKVCEKGLLRPGDIFKYPEKGPARILNFAVKDHWRYPSKEIWVQQCLENFCSNYKEWQVNSIALPLMGTKNGGLSESRIEKMTRDYLAGIDDLDVEENE